MEAVGEPGRKTRLGGGQIHPRHADLGKSEFQCPHSRLRHDLRTIDLTAVERHLPIVKRVWTSEEDTRAFAARLAMRPAIADVFIALHGELGAGKTTLVRHLLHALGVQGRIKSPTYAVVEPYQLAHLCIWHFDFYRFSDPREWDDAGFRDLFASKGLKLAEWPDNAGAVLPRADLVVRIEVRDDDSRDVTLTAQSPAGQELLQ